MNVHVPVLCVYLIAQLTMIDLPYNAMCCRKRSLLVLNQFASEDVYIHAIFVGMADRRASKRAFRFFVCFGGALSTRHACRAIVALDLYTRNHFSESHGFTVRWPQTKGTASNERVQYMVSCLLTGAPRTKILTK